jgi:hypothetical protein
MLIIYGRSRERNLEVIIEVHARYNGAEEEAVGQLDSRVCVFNFLFVVLRLNSRPCIC